MKHVDNTRGCVRHRDGVVSDAQEKIEDLQVVVRHAARVGDPIRICFGALVHGQGAVKGPGNHIHSETSKCVTRVRDVGAPGHETSVIGT